MGRHRHDLLAAAEAKDTGAYKECFFEYFDTFRLMAYEATGDANLAENLVRHFFVHFWNHPGKYALTARPGHEGLFNAFLDSHSLLNSQEAQEQVSGSRMVTRIYRMLQQVEEPAQSCFKMACFNGLSCRKIASKLQIPRQQVHQHLSRVLQHLHQHFSAEDLKAIRNLNMLSFIFSEKTRM